MVVIRLTRVGKKKQAHYRIVVADSHRAVKGKFISILGWYNPHTKELQVKKEDLQAWFDKGAMPSNTLAKLLKKEKIQLPKWVKIIEKKKKPKVKGEPKEKAVAPKTEGSKEEGGEKPVEEVKEEKTEEAIEAPKKEEKAEESGEPIKEAKEERAPAENTEGTEGKTEEPKK